MVNLEQIKLLETKVVKAIEHLQRLTRENSLLREQEAGLKRRIDELAAEVKHYKEHQSRMEAGISLALERLDQFEDTMVTLAGKKAEARPAGVPQAEAKTGADSDLPDEGQGPDQAKSPDPDQGPAQAHGKKGSLLRTPEEKAAEKDTAELFPEGRNSDQPDIF